MDVLKISDDDDESYEVLCFTVILFDQEQHCGFESGGTFEQNNILQLVVEIITILQFIIKSGGYISLSPMPSLYKSFKEH